MTNPPGKLTLDDPQPRLQRHQSGDQFAHFFRMAFHGLNFIPVRELKLIACIRSWRSQISAIILGNGRNDDGRDVSREAFQFGITFGKQADRHEGIIPEFIGQEIEPPAEDNNIGR